MIKFGNFYEIFDKDAVIASNILNYKLTKVSDTVKMQRAFLCSLIALIKRP